MESVSLYDLGIFFLCWFLRFCCTVGWTKWYFFFVVFFMLALSMFTLYLSLCLCPDLSKASWYGITDLLKISSDGDNDESQELIDSRSCLKLVSTIFYQFFIFSSNDSPSKTEKSFLFHLKSSFRSRDIQIFVFFPHPFHFFQIQKDKWKWDNSWFHGLACINFQV